MADEKEEPAKGQPKMQRGWDFDVFPTSAQPVFLGAGILIALVAILCAIVYYTSEHPLDPAVEAKKKEIASRLNDDQEP